jgi:2-amino-4-hydroxy-6-hydroxymethyldihydropteridine diphosphokinase
MEYGLSLGSNLGDRLRQLADAAQSIGALPGARILARSAVYETDPVDVSSEYEDRPFLNAVLIVEAAAEPAAMARHAHDIEARMGRVRQADRNAPRPVDIDLIYADALCVASPDLTLPHPRWAQRRFVVQPLADVRPRLILPGQTLCVARLLASLPSMPRVRPFGAWPDGRSF